MTTDRDSDYLAGLIRDPCKLPRGPRAVAGASFSPSTAIEDSQAIEFWLPRFFSPGNP